jgi:hypothetical protein
MRGIYITSSELKTYAVRSKVVSKTKIGQSRSDTTSEITTCMTHTMINPLSIAPHRELGTRVGSNRSHAT